MKACAALGHEVSLATVSDPCAEAIEGLILAHHFKLAEGSPVAAALPARWLQRRFRSFWGLSNTVLANLQAAAAECHADAVIAIGLDALPYLPPLSGTVRVWYPADEWIWHHVSQFRPFDRTTWGNLRDAAIKGVYERAHRRVVDRSWVVSDTEQRAMRWLAGMRHVDVLPLGVDQDFYQPSNEEPEPRTAVFWGRLDFGPNIQALDWFADRVWPLVRRQASDARFTIIGFNPGPEITRLAAIEGISIRPNVPDLRDLARRHSVLVLPLVSGGGMKNKLLEGAAMGLPIVCTPLAAQGLQEMSTSLLEIHSKPQAFANAILELWRDNAKRREAGRAARTWVTTHHSWAGTAARAIASLGKNQPVSRD